MIKKFSLLLTLVIPSLACTGCKLFKGIDFSGPQYDILYNNENKKIINLFAPQKASKDFISETVTDTLTYRFSSSIGVQTQTYYAAASGSYTFKSHSGDTGIKLKVNTGSIINDEFKTVPFTIDLTGGYEYKIEMSISNSKLLNKDIVIDINRPNISSSSKDITNLTSFTESNKTKGEVLTYYFTANATGLYSLKTSGVYGIDAYKFKSTGEPSRFENCYQDSLNFICNKGEKIMLQVKSNTDKEPGKIYFDFYKPNDNCSIKDFKADGPYYITMELYYKLQTQYFDIVAPVTGTYYFQSIIPPTDLGLKGNYTTEGFTLEKVSGSDSYKKVDNNYFRAFELEEGKRYAFTCQFTSDSLKKLSEPLKLCFVYTLSDFVSITEK